MAELRNNDIIFGFDEEKNKDLKPLDLFQTDINDVICIRMTGHVDTYNTPIFLIQG